MDERKGQNSVYFVAFFLCILLQDNFDDCFSEQQIQPHEDDDV